MRKGSKAIITWEKVYPPSEVRILSVDKKNNQAEAWYCGSKVKFPLDKLKKVK